jgi:hypothetical protein
VITISAGLPDDVTAPALAECYLGDLYAAYEADGLDPVDEVLAAAADIARTLLANHDLSLASPPTIRYNPLREGATYDPGANVLVVRQPRPEPPGGYALLDERGQSVLNVVATGFMAAYNQQLVAEYFAEHVAAANHIHDQQTETLLPGIDVGFTSMFGLHIDGDITDAELRADYIAAWLDHYADGDINRRRYELVARTLARRVEAADGDPQDRMTAALSIQRPLIAAGDLSVVSSGEPGQE